MRYLLLDKIEELKLGDSAKAIKCWSLDNEIFRDHFPGSPVVPGALLIESMAQLGGLLISKSCDDLYGTNGDARIYLGIIHKAKFRKFVQPGDQCFVEAKLILMDNIRANVNVRTLIKDDVVCDAKFSFFIDTQPDKNNNPYIHQMDEFFYILSKKI